MGKKIKKIVRKSPFSWGRKVKAGREEKSGTCVEFEDGTCKTLLTPSGKATKYAHELGVNQGVTNDGEYKVDKNGKPLGLTKVQRAYRSGYLDARKDNAKIYKAKKKKTAKK